MNGELLIKSNPSLGQTATFTYDVLGNLKSATLSGSTTVEYVIDGQNRRIGKKVNGTLTQAFLYSEPTQPGGGIGRSECRRVALRVQYQGERPGLYGQGRRDVSDCL